MNFDEAYRSAFLALKSNKIRTFLTMLGIIIGVFSVVLLVSLVRGVQNYVTDQFNALGSNLLFVMPGKSGINQDPATAFTDNKLEIKHVNLLLKEESGIIEEITPSSTAGMTAIYKGKRFFAMITGAYPSYEKIYKLELENGSFYTQADEGSSRSVVVLGAAVNKSLFGSKDGVGETIKINGNSFEVVGILKTKAQDFDQTVTMPFSTARNTLEVKDISYITAKIEADQDSNIAMKRVQIALLSDLSKDDFTVLNQGDLLQSIQGILQMLSFALGGIAAISLLVGGIGIMNIMLVAVTERVREIGLRKALGATSGGIATQFLLESVILSLAGGLIGLLLGVLGALIARNFIRAEVPLWAVLLSLGFSLAVGIIFGTYPAYRASKKDPIESLRYE